jgi:Zn finger protein HypA/HybF involved in hydrogenase expression
MTLEGVWSVLEDGEWESKQALADGAGVDDDNLNRVIDFLDRWRFVEVQRTPELLVRRRPGSVSPLDTFQLLNTITNVESTQSVRRRIAERVACRTCGGRNLTLCDHNQVECAQCHDKQWYAIETGEALSLIKPENSPGAADLDPVRRMFLRLGIPQKAFSANIPKPTQYFWFRCTRCGKTSADYPHSYARYLTCPSCQTHTHFK